MPSDSSQTNSGPAARAFGDEARSEQERPVVDRDQRPAGRHERARVSTGGSRDVLSQGHDRKQADDADGDEVHSTRRALT